MLKNHKWLSATEDYYKTYKLQYPITSGVNDDNDNNSYRRKSNAKLNCKAIETISVTRNAKTANIFLTCMEQNVQVTK